MSENFRRDDSEHGGGFQIKPLLSKPRNDTFFPPRCIRNGSRCIGNARCYKQRTLRIPLPMHRERLPMHRERAVLQTEDPTNTPPDASGTAPDASGTVPDASGTGGATNRGPHEYVETRIRHRNLSWRKTPPGGFEPRPKGLRGRNSPTCTLSQNGYGTPRCGQKGRTNISRTRGGSRSTSPNTLRSRARDGDLKSCQVQLVEQ